MAEAVAALHHLDAAALHQIVRRQPVDALALELDAALGDIAAFGAHQVGDRFQRGRLAGAVGPQQRDDAALRDLERHALQHQDDVIVDDLDVLYREDRLRRLGHGAVSRSSQDIRHESCTPAGFRYGRRR
jgi:hypothetical protein